VSIFVVTITGEIRVQIGRPRPPRARGTTNRNARGSAEARRRRKRWLLTQFGDGVTAPCFMAGCTAVLTFDTITVDRIILGINGGSYRRSNIRPACASHNASEGSKAMHARRGRGL
jgi:hypothetical protein